MCKGDEDSSAHGFGVDFAQAFDDLGVSFAAEDFGERLRASSLTETRRRKSRQAVEQLSLSLWLRTRHERLCRNGLCSRKRRIEMGEQPVPTLFNGGNVRTSVFAWFAPC